MSDYTELKELIEAHEMTGDPSIANELAELRELIEAREVLAEDLDEMADSWANGDAFERAGADPARQAVIENQLEGMDEDISSAALKLFGI